MSTTLFLTHTQEQKLNQRGFVVIELETLDSFSLFKSQISLTMLFHVYIFLFFALFFIPILSFYDTNEYSLHIAVSLYTLLFLYYSLHFSFSKKVNGGRMKTILKTHTHEIYNDVIKESNNKYLVLDESYSEILSKSRDFSNKSLWHVCREKNLNPLSYILILGLYGVTFVSHTIFFKKFSFEGRFQKMMKTLQKNADTIDENAKKIDAILSQMEDGEYNSSVFKKNMENFGVYVDKNFRLYQVLKKNLRYKNMSHIIDENIFDSWIANKTIFPLEKLKSLLEKHYEATKNMIETPSYSAHIQLAQKRLALAHNNIKSQISKLEQKIQTLKDSI